MGREPSIFRHLPIAALSLNAALAQCSASFPLDRMPKGCGGFSQGALPSDVDPGIRFGDGRGADSLREFTASRAMKTGTTIAGIVFEGGVVLGADTRATGGKTVCDRNCDKIHILASNMACCGAGTSADAVRVTEGVRLALLRMTSEMQACLPTRTAGALESGAAEEGERALSHQRSVEDVQREHLRVSAAAFLLKRHLFRHQGIVSAALVLGGVDIVGAHLYQIHEGGSCAEVDFAAMGSGSLAALSVLEVVLAFGAMSSETIIVRCKIAKGGGYRAGLCEEDAKKLVLAAVSAGIVNDLGSGSNVDLCIISTKGGLVHQRGAYKDDSVTYDPDESRDDLKSYGGNDVYLSGAAHGDTGDSDQQAISRRDRASVVARVSGAWSATSGSAGAPTQKFSNLHSALGPSNSLKSRLSVADESGLNRPTMDVGGRGGSRAWVGSVRRRGRDKIVVRVDEDGEVVRTISSSAVDDRIEVL